MVTFPKTHLERRLGEFQNKVNKLHVCGMEYFPSALSSHRHVCLNITVYILDCFEYVASLQDIEQILSQQMVISCYVLLVLC